MIKEVDITKIKEPDHAKRNGKGPTIIGIKGGIFGSEEIKVSKRKGGKALAEKIAEFLSDTKNGYNISTNALLTAIQKANLQARLEGSKIVVNRTSNLEVCDAIKNMIGLINAVKDDEIFIMLDYRDIIKVNGATNNQNDANGGSSDKTDLPQKKEYPKNMILYGPPGTGKTYNTVIYAVAIIEGWDKKDWENHYNNYNDILKKYNEYKKDNRIAFTTFHQSYGYEDFIEGIRPELDGAVGLKYILHNGVFKAFCDEAGKPGNKHYPISVPTISKSDESESENTSEEKTSDNYVFIIDEINRGNISKIFGELITLIEDNKRLGAKEEMTAILPYSGIKKDENGNKIVFGVPNNVYIIGTMNTADRSIALLDTALRRRFTFIEMLPDSKTLDGIKVNGLSIKQLLEVMNKRITALYDRDHTIGHSYFIGLKDNDNIDALVDIMINKVVPLLQEYFYDDFEKIRIVLGDDKEGKEPKFIDVVTPVDITGGHDSYTINKDAFKKAEAYQYLQKDDTTATSTAVTTDSAAPV